MSETSVPTDGRSVSPVAAIVVILLTVVLVVLGGFGLGKKVFWKLDTRTTVERDLAITSGKVSSNPNDPNLRIELGKLYAQQKKYDLAMQEFNHALEIEPDNYDAKFQIAVLKAETGEYQEAEKMLTEFLKKYPKYVPGHKVMAYVMEKQEKYKEAIKEYSIVSQVTVPKDVQVLFKLGQLYEKIGDKANAKKAYQETLRYSPTFEDAKKAMEKLGN